MAWGRGRSVARGVGHPRVNTSRPVRTSRSARRPRFAVVARVQGSPMSLSLVRGSVEDSRNPSMSVRYLGSSAGLKDRASLASCRFRRPTSAWNSFYYIAATHRRRAGFKRAPQTRDRGDLSQLLVARPQPGTRQRGTLRPGTHGRHHFAARRGRRPLPRRRHGG